MDHEFLRREHPEIARRIDMLDLAELAEAVHRVVKGVLARNHIAISDTEPGYVRARVDALDEEAWTAQEDVDRGARPVAEYEAAFRRARAANAFLDEIEGRLEAAVYEALHALGGDERQLLQVLDEAKR